jgi:hypothetical protein
MSSLTVSRSYHGAGATQNAIPASLTPNTFSKPIKAEARVIQIPNNGGTISAGGQVTFNIPSGNGYLRGNSCYLSAQVNVTQAANSYQFAGTEGSCASLFNRLTVTVGGTQIESVNNYGLLHNAILTHATTPSYCTNDANISEYTNLAAEIAFNGAAPQISMPILSGILCSEKAFPLFLLKSPLQISLDVASIAQALKVTVTAVTALTLSNIYLTYEVTEVDQQHIDSVYAMLASGKLYECAFSSFMGMQTSTTASLSYNVGLNLASVLGAFYTEQTSAAAANTAQKNFQSDGVTGLRIYVDGKQLVGYTIGTTSQLFSELERTLGVMTDSSITSNSTQANYLTTKFLSGCNTRKFSEFDLVMTGMTCQNLQFVVDHSGGVTAGTTSYMWVLFSGILLIGVQGNVEVAK